MEKRIFDRETGLALWQICREYAIKNWVLVGLDKVELSLEPKDWKFIERFDAYIDFADYQKEKCQ